MSKRKTYSGEIKQKVIEDIRNNNLSFSDAEKSMELLTQSSQDGIGYILKKI